MWREDADGFCTACPIRELSIRPARESEDGGASEGDMPCRTIGIRMRERLERIIRVAGIGEKRISDEIREGQVVGEGLNRDIRNVDSQDFFNDLDLDEEIEGTSTRVSQFSIAGGFFTARTGLWTTEATLVETSGEDTPFLGADLRLEECGRIRVRFRRLRRL